MSTNDPTQTNGWKIDAKMVLHRLDRIDQELHGIDKRLRQIEGKIWVLQTKAAMIGAIAGFIAGVIDTKECMESLVAAGALASLKSAITKAEV